MKKIQSIPYPEYTTSERDLLTDIVDGSIIKNTTINKFQVYKNSAWINIFMEDIVLNDNDEIASIDNEGTLRYKKIGNNSYIDICMQTGVSTYTWVNLIQYNW